MARSKYSLHFHGTPAKLQSISELKSKDRRTADLLSHDPGASRHIRSLTPGKVQNVKPPLESYRAR